MTINWDDPAERAALLDRVGPAEYTRLIGAHRAASVIETVNGHDIYPVGGRFGRLFAVGKSGRAFTTLDEARAFANDTTP